MDLERKSQRQGIETGLDLRVLVAALAQASLIFVALTVILGRIYLASYSATLGLPPLVESNLLQYAVASPDVGFFSLIWASYASVLLWWPTYGDSLRFSGSQWFGAVLILRGIVFIGAAYRFDGVLGMAGIGLGAGEVFCTTGLLMLSPLLKACGGLLRAARKLFSWLVGGLLRRVAGRLFKRLAGGLLRRVAARLYKRKSVAPKDAPPLPAPSPQLVTICGYFAWVLIVLVTVVAFAHGIFAPGRAQLDFDSLPATQLVLQSVVGFEEIMEKDAEGAPLQRTVPLKVVATGTDHFYLALNEKFDENNKPAIFYLPKGNVLGSKSIPRSDGS